MLDFEIKNCQEFELILGLDEAGRGCCAGPLVVAGVILPKNYVNTEINDSKKLSLRKREQLFEQIIKDALAYKIVVLASKYVDQHNPKQSSKNGMEQICTEIEIKPDLVITDFEHLPNISIKQLNLVKGDSISISVAAASILAKVVRDKIMEEWDKRFPNYGFKQHKGYNTKLHQEKLEQFGPSPIHRKSYKNVQKAIKK
ncbi:ribonuclease HII [Mycoplasmopsis iners]|uniref:ribonuclease HII n=1 Tax=Mycoplasmopsis iners TaxID=76630 RepID=UPI0004964F4C|nr:ribonuclease HII [Mycoplasmopsis iners]